MFRFSRSSLRLLTGLFALLALASGMATATATDAEPLEPQTIHITDTGTGDGPCGFEIQHDLDGEFKVTPVIDDSGALVLSIQPLSLHGTLTNPANGASVELKWVCQNGMVSFDFNGSSTDVSLPLIGHLMRGYDTADSKVEMNLPANGVEPLTFEPGQHSPDPWAHVCGLLS